MVITISQTHLGLESIFRLCTTRHATENSRNLTESAFVCYTDGSGAWSPAWAATGFVLLDGPVQGAGAGGTPTSVTDALATEHERPL
jgi:hypothetical protein